MHSEANDDEEIWGQIDWNDLRTFLAVAETGSLNAAAKVLKMTQPTISRRMEEFEYRLKARLFERSTRGIVLTEAGAMVRDVASRMARLSGTIEREVAGHDNSRGGAVRLSTSDGVASVWLAPRLPKFQMENPEIQLTFDCGLGPPSALDADSDLTLDMNADGAPDMVTTPVATLHYRLFASRDYLEVYGTPKSLPEMTLHRVVKYMGHKEQKETWHPKATAVSALADFRFITNSGAAVLQAIRSGAGIGSLPTAMAVLDPNLVMLDIDPWASVVLFLRHRRAIENQVRVKRVKEWLLDVFDAADKPWFREEFIHPREFPAITSPALARRPQVVARSA